MGQLEYEAAKHNVSRFMREHTERVKRVWGLEDKASRPTLFMSDVDGTLRGSSVAAELDQFLCDLHDAGLPVMILSGRDPQPNAFEITKRLAANGDAWFVGKPMDISEIMPGLIFDDDHSFVEALDYLGVTGLHPESLEVVEFLKSWVLLVPEDKAEILKPLADFHKQIAGVKVEANMIRTHSAVDSGPAGTDKG